MPQLDMTIFSTSTANVLFFWIGYLIISKYYLPIIAIELKIKQKVMLHYMSWFKNNLNDIHFFNLAHTKLLIKVKNLLKASDIFCKKKNIFYGIYTLDMYFIKNNI